MRTTLRNPCGVLTVAGMATGGVVRAMGEAGRASMGLGLTRRLELLAGKLRRTVGSGPPGVKKRGAAVVKPAAPSFNTR